MKSSLHALSLVLALTALCGCVSQSVMIEHHDEPQPETIEPVIEPHFEAVPARGPEVIAALRAQPAPVRPEIVDGKNRLGDERALNARGFVHVGSGHFAIDDASAERQAVELGTRTGADHIVLYRNQPVEGDAHAEFLAVYYVRFKLLFGATFRNLTAKEREMLEGGNGVELGSVVGSTPAAEANLIAGDLVIMFNGKRFRDRVEFQELLRSQAGKPVTLTIRRNELTMDRVVRLGAMPPSAGER